MIKAVIFDFDGLILDTETPDFRAWQEIYAEYGLELPLSEWGTFIGSFHSPFNPFDYLVASSGMAIDRKTIQARHHRRNMQLIAEQGVRPGVDSYIAAARQLGLALGIASSSPSEWVHGHLDRLGLLGQFDQIVTADDVRRTKPDPALFVEALRRLDVLASEAIVLEDSPNGIAAAKRAGIFCVAVPNPVSKMLPLDGADLVIDSLDDLPLADLIARV